MAQLDAREDPYAAALAKGDRYADQAMAQLDARGDPYRPHVIVTDSARIILFCPDVVQMWSSIERNDART